MTQIIKRAWIPSALAITLGIRWGCRGRYRLDCSDDGLRCNRCLGDRCLGDGRHGDGCLGDGRHGDVLRRDGCLGDGCLGDGCLGDGCLGDGCCGLERFSDGRRGNA
jgi:hypothetical protein